MKKVYAQDNPQCLRCKHRSHIAGQGTSSMAFCDYIIDTGIVPGYVGKDKRYHRKTYPVCKEFEEGKPDDRTKNFGREVR